MIPRKNMLFLCSETGYVHDSKMGTYLTQSYDCKSQVMDKSNTRCLAAFRHTSFLFLGRNLPSTQKVIFLRH